MTGRLCNHIGNHIGNHNTKVLSGMDQGESTGQGCKGGGGE